MHALMRDRIALASATVVVFVSRLPFLAPGWGMDPDSYRLALVAQEMAETGVYTASRMPGYPLQELLLARIVDLGPWAANLASAIFSAVAFLAFALVLRTWKVKEYLLVALAFAFAPVVYVSSTSTIDYIWAFAFLLVSLRLLQSRKVLLSGICLGLAAGCRLGSIAMAAPLLLYWYLDRRGDARHGREPLIFMLGAAAASMACFFPVFERYGLGFLAFEGDYPRLARIAANLTTRVWGTIGLLAFALLVPHLRRGVGILWRGLRSRSTGPAIAFAVVSVAILGAMFARMPHEPGYLLPAVPWILFLAAYVLPRRTLRAFLLLMILSPFVLSVDKGGITPHGRIFRDQRDRIALAEQTEETIAQARRLDHEAVIVAGYHYPPLRLRLGSEQVGQARFVRGIHDAQEFARFAGNDGRVYYLPDMDRYMRRAYGVDLNALGAKCLHPVSLAASVRQ